MNTNKRLPNDFAVFILSHGRPDHVLTVEALQKSNYTGRWYIVIDNEDKTAQQYHDRYGDKVITFDKAATAQAMDEGDNFNDRRAVIYARNACFPIAKQLGVRYFMQLDDDYRMFAHRMSRKQRYLNAYSETTVRNLDKILALYLEYFKSAPFTSLAMAQTGDFLGGYQAHYQGDSIFESMGRRRKCMNTFICATDRPFQFFGRINEDVNTYVTLGNRGALFMTFPHVSIQQAQTQKSKGGMTDLYLTSGTYVKSFYTVMYCPSAARVAMLHSGNNRMHHKIEWRNAVPVILRESVRKPDEPAKKARQKTGKAHT